MSYLVIHGTEVKTRDVKQIAKLAGSTRTEKIGKNAFHLHDYKTREGVAEYCAKAKLDFAFMPEPRRLSDFRLVAMDMDSTLITIECIDEIADLRGIKPQVAAITASAMRGDIEYHESLRRRLALLEGLMRGRGIQAVRAEASSNAHGFYVRRGYQTIGVRTADGALPIGKRL